MIGLNLLEIVERYRYREDLGVLFDYKQCIYHRLENESARFFWVNAQQGKSLEEISLNASHKWKIPLGIIRKDADEFFKSLSNSTRNNTRQINAIEKGFGKSLQFPLRLEIEVTSLCNWNCSFCYNVWKTDPGLSDEQIADYVRSLPAKHLSFDSACRIIDQAAEGGCMIIRYSGGETLLNPDLLKILEYGGRKRMYQVVFTNGHFVTSEWAQAAKNANVGTVLLSLHGNEAMHNTLVGNKIAYNRVLSSIEILHNAGIEVVVEYALVKANLSTLMATINDMRGMGVRNFSVMRYVSTGKNDGNHAVDNLAVWEAMQAINLRLNSDWPDLVIRWPCSQKFCTSDQDQPINPSDQTLRIRTDQIESHCEAGLIWGSVSFDGRLRTCPHSNVYFGSAIHSIKDGWQEMTREVHHVLAPRESCLGCAALASCKGGCHLVHFIDNRPI